LLKGYKPIIDKIGEPISAGFIDVSDDFNYHEEKNEKIARVSQFKTLTYYKFIC